MRIILRHHGVGGHNLEYFWIGPEDWDDMRQIIYIKKSSKEIIFFSPFPNERDAAGDLI